MHNSMCVYLCILQSLFHLGCDIWVGRPSQCVISLNQAPKCTHFNLSSAFFQWPMQNRVFWQEGWALNTHRDQIMLPSPMGGLPRTGLAASAVALLFYLFMDKPRNGTCRPLQAAHFWSKTLLILKGVKTLYLSIHSAGRTCISFNLHCTS